MARRRREILDLSITEPITTTTDMDNPADEIYLEEAPEVCAPDPVIEEASQDLSPTEAPLVAKSELSATPTQPNLLKPVPKIMPVLPVRKPTSTLSNGRRNIPKFS